MQWLEPWEPIGTPETEEQIAFTRGWEKELEKEVGPGHVLYGLKAALIARRYDCDDALYQLANGRVAKVHLTWKQGRESAPQWPETVVYSSLGEWAEKGLRLDHAEWIGDCSYLLERWRE